MALKTHLYAKVQAHQRTAVMKCVAGNDTVKSGILTLPCGSGKTLIGVVLMTMARVRTLIVAYTPEIIE